MEANKACSPDHSNTADGATDLEQSLMLSRSAYSKISVQRYDSHCLQGDQPERGKRRILGSNKQPDCG